jgi:hypothetical protein
MKLWRISQNERTGYDTYDSAVVAAETEEAAKATHPSGTAIWEDNWFDWATSPAGVSVEYLGEGSGEARVICASFNAG